ncbi:MAG: hypothetical protein ACRDNL_04445 [Spirillospora sp.]
MTAQHQQGGGGQWTTGHTAPPGTIGVPRKRSPILPIVAGAVAAAAILAVAGFLLWPDGSSDNGGQAGGPVGGQPSQNLVTDTSTPDTPTTPASSTPSQTPLPDGLVMSSGPGYSIGVPRGWRRSVQGNSVIWTDPASSAYVQVDQTQWSGDPYQHWVTWEQEALADGKLKGFQRIGEITRTSVGGVPAADIEFTWAREGLTRARDRGVVVDGRPYAVVVAVPASQWNENEALVKNVLDTFRPSGVG